MFDQLDCGNRTNSGSHGQQHSRGECEQLPGTCLLYHVESKFVPALWKINETAALRSVVKSLRNGATQRPKTRCEFCCVGGYFLRLNATWRLRLQISPVFFPTTSVRDLSVVQQKATHTTCCLSRLEQCTRFFFVSVIDSHSIHGARFANSCWRPHLSVSLCHCHCQHS